MPRPRQRIDVWLPDAGARLDEGRGLRSRSEYVAELIAADVQRQRDSARPTLLSQARTDPDGVRARMMAALTLTDGNATTARGLLHAAEDDWASAVAALALASEIAERWPALRAAQRKDS